MAIRGSLARIGAVICRDPVRLKASKEVVLAPVLQVEVLVPLVR